MQVVLLPTCKRAIGDCPFPTFASSSSFFFLDPILSCRQPNPAACVDPSSVASRSGEHRLLCAFRSKGHRYARVNPVPVGEEAERMRERWVGKAGLHLLPMYIPTIFIYTYHLLRFSHPPPDVSPSLFHLSPGDPVDLSGLTASAELSSSRFDSAEAAAAALSDIYCGNMAVQFDAVEVNGHIPFFFFLFYSSQSFSQSSFEWGSFGEP